MLKSIDSFGKPKSIWTPRFRLTVLSANFFSTYVNFAARTFEVDLNKPCRNLSQSKHLPLLPPPGSNLWRLTLIRNQQLFFNFRSILPQHPSILKSIRNHTKLKSQSHGRLTCWGWPAPAAAEMVARQRMALTKPELTFEYIILRLLNWLFKN